MPKAAVLAEARVWCKQIPRMTIRYSWHDPVLINTVGHCAGALLFCVIILLLIRNWRTHGISRAKLPLVAAALALGWNVGSLLILGSPDAAPEWIAAVATASFSMLTILPAVLLHVALQGRQRLKLGSCILLRVLPRKPLLNIILGVVYEAEDGTPCNSLYSDCAACNSGTFVSASRHTRKNSS